MLDRLDRLESRSPDKFLTIWADTNTRCLNGVPAGNQAPWAAPAARSPSASSSGWPPERAAGAA